jgi:hypothetical protein
MWMGCAFCTALFLAAIVIARFGAGERGTDLALMTTARLSFLLFWLAYAGKAITALFGPTFKPLRNHGREFGLAFASAQLVHIGLVVWLCSIGAAPPLSTFIFFGIALFWTCLLVLASFERLRCALGSKAYWLLHIVGVNYIAYAFAVDFLRKPLFVDVKQIVVYLPFAVLSVAGPLLRIGAFAQRLWIAERPSLLERADQRPL